MMEVAAGGAKSVGAEDGMRAFMERLQGEYTGAQYFTSCTCQPGYSARSPQVTQGMHYDRLDESDFDRFDKAKEIALATIPERERDSARIFPRCDSQGNFAAPTHPDALLVFARAFFSDPSLKFARSVATYRASNGYPTLFIDAGK